MWLCDPGYTQHKAGLGTPDALDAIRKNDRRLSRMIGSLPADTSALVASGHGFSTANKAHRPAPYVVRLR
ncbi:MAG: hypothetical protein CME19_24070 [Gemmatimonadetes bacterium]|nr:hypothetical protein [Gemmatimonadota bacterium]